MAVRAQYAHNFLRLNRMNRVETNKNNETMDRNLATNMLEQSHGNGNWRKRGREASSFLGPQKQQIVFSFQPPMVLGLSHQQSDSLFMADFSNDLAAQINNDNNEIDRFIAAQGEQLRQTLADKYLLHHGNLLESVKSKLLEKQAEIERAGRFNVVLEDRLTRLQTELLEWQAMAMTEHAAAVSLHAQLQKSAISAATPLGGEEFISQFPVEDSESVYIDPDRSAVAERACRICLRRPAMVVLFPCCHLCLCVSCDSAGAVGDACPVCTCLWTGSLQISIA